jgi:hypothetical protein
MAEGMARLLLVPNDCLREGSGESRRKVAEVAELLQPE